MPIVLRTNRVAHDVDILRYNACGLSLRTVGALTGVHPTSVAARLRLLKAPPADTRRAFMEDVFAALSQSEQEWLCDELNQQVPVKQYVINLIKNAHQKARIKNVPDRNDDQVVPGGSTEPE